MGDQLIWATDRDGQIRLIAARTTELVAEAQSRHKSWPTATAALGRAMTAALLMGAMQKGEEKITLRILGDGPLGAIVAQSNAQGEVRGYVQNPTLDWPSRSPEKLDVGGAVGATGHLHVTRDLGLKESYTGSAPLVSGEIAEDLTHYFATSEQTPTAVALGVLLNEDGTVQAAGGYLLQLLPGVSEEKIEHLEKKIKELGPISYFFASGKDVASLLDPLLPEEDKKILAQKKPFFQCQCDRLRLETMLKSLGAQELAEMRKEQGGAEVVCHFCNEQYIFSVDELIALEKELE
ncbi:Hsp33 family molecular chaperone HslO [Heliorestis acidaminivorans]|uniref:33 kDa chaperonin n=1 Tax=Heliorestis acidaminivorans TaxID=553427 RepID=A0A6I0F377_9FIRM|nr:Hsp33 family molecular chaperone HslO [Heliorestis acidaminivorans]KAB2954461.1 Hsp33 family molecular chaperone HslO [Heliorestis acidaminivorans]